MRKYIQMKYGTTMLLAIILLAGFVGATLLNYWQHVDIDVNLKSSLTIDGKDYTQPIHDIMTMKKGDQKTITHIFRNAATQVNVSINIVGLNDFPKGFTLTFKESKGTIKFPITLNTNSSRTIDFIYKSSITIPSPGFEVILYFTADIIPPLPPPVPP